MEPPYDDHDSGLQTIFSMNYAVLVSRDCQYI